MCVPIVVCICVCICLQWEGAVYYLNGKQSILVDCNCMCGGQILGKEKGAWTGHFEGERTGVKYLLKVTCTSASFQLRNHTHLDWLKGA